MSRMKRIEHYVGNNGLPLSSAARMAFVHLKDVTFFKRNRPIFNNLSFSVEKGKIIAVMGPSGSGKTTLLKMIAGQIRPDSGSVHFLGEAIYQLSREALYSLRKKMSMLFQSGSLFTDLTLFENVAFPLREHTRLPESLIRVVVLMKLEAVGLRGAAQLMPSQLSGGMARRGALARAMVLDPELIMFDEPFAGQDPITTNVLMQLIQSLNDAMGITCIVVSHDIQELLSIADYAYLLSEGKMLAEGTPEALMNASDPFITQFIEGLIDGPVPFHYPAAPYEASLLC